ncbi:hypothetical protein [Wenzhouxiangella sediminis]|uniref:Uncharacterized protein n=1 Tax=Wenzhouxiangella sediminis TaxID=1792836 RepID=A0A3E1K640_9GAMM|nr:hypothetical protein [Wenzhouxiangella sediminis]RFF29406.1 hypothetical protein DZC52_13250 [Wenzhouxiangella sediminis]
MAFLSLLDDRARPKGSRDPLGFEMVWTHFGRRVVGNLTTITSSLSNFAVALLGFHWANEIHADASADERRAKVLESFLRYEQLAGYLRYLGGDRDIMGITRVSRRMTSGDEPIRFGMSADDQILSDQTSYGLWGLYASPMQNSGLISGDDRQPTQVGFAVSRRLERGLEKASLTDLFMSERKVSAKSLEHHSKSFVAAIADSDTREQLLEILMQGGEGNAVQQEIWQITRELAGRDALPERYPDFVAALKASTSNPQIESRLTALDSVERLLVAVNNLFDYCRRKDGERLELVLAQLEGRYDFSYIPNDIDFEPAGSRGALLERIRSALRAGETEKAVLEILELNRQVMEDRDGAPWVEVENNGRLRVRVPKETAVLRPSEELKYAWDYDYFMGSYLAIARDALL